MYIYILELVGYVLDHYGCPDLHIHLWIVKLQTRLAAGRRRVPRPPSHVNALLLLLLTHLCSSSSEWDAMREVSSQVITNVVIEARWEWLRMTLVVTVVVVGRGRRRRRVVLKRRSSRVEHHERRDFFFFFFFGQMDENGEQKNGEGDIIALHASRTDIDSEDQLPFLVSCRSNAVNE